VQSCQWCIGLDVTFVQICFLRNCGLQQCVLQLLVNNVARISWHCCDVTVTQQPNLSPRKLQLRQHLCVESSSPSCTAIIIVNLLCFCYIWCVELPSKLTSTQRRTVAGNNYAVADDRVCSAWSVQHSWRVTNQTLNPFKRNINLVLLRTVNTFCACVLLMNIN